MNANNAWCGFCMAILAVLATAASMAAQTVVRVRDDIAFQRSFDPGSLGQGGAQQLRREATDACALLPNAVQGQVVAGGTLVPLAWANTACVARSGTIAFVAGIAGTLRNQGVFVADGSGVRALAIGCGGGGGSGVHGSCGDPAPGGGTFAGFFTGTVFAPSIDDDDDVLFLADVRLGTATVRALFLFDAAAQTIARIAAVGDAAPGGGTFAAIGPGVVCSDGGGGGANGCTVAFLARMVGGGTASADLFRWCRGAVGRLAAVGDPLPGGGAIAALATESLGFVDGTSVPIGPLPALNACGAVAFRVQGSGGAASGILVRADIDDGRTDTWHLRVGDQAPGPGSGGSGGGTFAAFAGPLLNGNGAVAVFADVAVGASMSSGWFVGRPGAMRRALAFYDQVDGGPCLGLAVSRGPMTPLDDAGNLTIWCDLANDGSQERIVESACDGTLRVLARRGDPTPVGGVFGTLNAWPARTSSGRSTVSARVLGGGGPGGTADGHFAAIACEPVVAASPCARLGGSVRVDDQGPAASTFVLAASLAATELPLPPWGTLRIGPCPLWWLLPPTQYPGAWRPHTSWWPVPGDAALAGVALHFQALALGAPGLSLGAPGLSLLATGALLTNRATTVLR